MPERCVDASIAVKWVVKGESWRKKARKFLQDSIAAGITLIAPPLFEYETESVLQRLLHSGALTVTDADKAIAQLAVISVQLVTHPDMVGRARTIARQFNQQRIYDSL
jgi:predicted nucleic acid-binding protein